MFKAPAKMGKLEMEQERQRAMQAAKVKQNSVPPEELAALKELYNSTNGPEWKQQEGWEEGSKLGPKDWYGVTVHERRVTEIVLNSNGLDGCLPASLSALHKLEVLDLRDNRLAGKIPDIFGELQSLSDFSLGRNQLTGRIPRSLLSGTLKNIWRIDISFNHLSGMLSPDIGNLVSINFLYLNNNDGLSGPLPEEIGNLTSCCYLRLSNNNFDGELPETMGQMTKLKYLELDYNKFCGPVPNFLGSLHRLMRVKLNANEFQGILPSSLMNLKVKVFHSSRQF
jgi:Leucine-rich repeat (LRR) protein